jgi:hypothetical protein
MDSSNAPKDEIWFLRMCHHISNAVYQVRYMHVLVMPQDKVYEAVMSCKGGKRVPDAVIGTLTENLKSPKVARIGH